MDTELSIGEFSVVVVAQSHNPSILNPDFLRHNEIVPGDWAVEGDPVSLPPFSQVQFDNGITVVADMARLVVTEDTLDKSVDDVQAHEIVRRYVRQLPHVSYQAIGINPKGHVRAESRDEAEGFVSARMLSSGPWSSFEGEDARAAVSLRYPIQQGNFNVAVEAGALQRDSEGEALPVAFFVGNFHRDLQQGDEPAIVKQIDALLDSSHDDIGTFKAFVEAMLRG